MGTYSVGEEMKNVNVIKISQDDIIDFLREKGKISNEDISCNFSTEMVFKKGRKEVEVIFTYVYAPEEL